MRSLRVLVVFLVGLWAWSATSAPANAQAQPHGSAAASSAEPGHDPAREPAPRATGSARAGDPRASTPLPAVPVDTAGARSRSTPRRALAGFLRLCADNDFAHAAEYLDLTKIPRERRTREAPELAAMLYRVLTWRIVLDPDQLSDEREGDGQPVTLDTAEVDGEALEIRLTRVHVGSEDVWLFARETVADIRTIYDANERRWLEDYVPAFLKRGQLGGAAPWQWLGLALLLGLAYATGRVFGAFATALLLRLLRGARPWITVLIRRGSRPARLALALVVFAGASPYLLLPRRVELYVGYAQNTLSIGALAWALVVLLRVTTTSYEATLPEDTAGHMENRGLRTRLAMVRRVGAVLIGIVAVGVILMQFDVVRSVGLSILASAGIAGILVGFAAQRTLGGIVSGIEMSITQPLRIGDVVVIDGEQGQVERMFFTYVVLKLWDERRLIVPVQRVMSGSFENWTRMGAELLAPVEIFVDYQAPIDALRAEFKRLCHAHPLWDGRSSAVHVVEATDKGVKLRGVASVNNAARAFELRSSLREGWVRFVQELEGGVYLPRGRVTSVAVPADASLASTVEPEAPPPSSVAKPRAADDDDR